MKVPYLRISDFERANYDLLARLYFILFDEISCIEAASLSSSPIAWAQKLGGSCRMTRARTSAAGFSGLREGGHPLHLQ